VSMCCLEVRLSWKRHEAGRERRKPLKLDIVRNVSCTFTRVSARPQENVLLRVTPDDGECMVLLGNSFQELRHALARLPHANSIGPLVPANTVCLS
jgi:hypothetical protein